MEPISPATELSVRKSRGRFRLLFALNAVGEAYLGQLARMVGAERRRVRGMLLGDPPRYREDLALVALGLVDVVDDPQGRTFRITREGRRKARSLAKRMASPRGERRA